MARAPSVHSISASPAPPPPSLHHHHDHEHHHHHSHYEREVKEDGAVVEKTVTEDIVETPADPTTAGSGVAGGEPGESGAPGPGGAGGAAGSGGKKGNNKKKNKGKNKVVNDTIVDETLSKGPAAAVPAESVAPIDSISQAPTKVAKAPSVKAQSVKAPSEHHAATVAAPIDAPAMEEEIPEIINEKTKEVIITKTTTTRTIQPAPEEAPAPAPPASRAPSVRAPSIRAPSIKAPIRPPTIVAAPTAAPGPTPAPSIVPLPINAPAPPSPTPSHRSHRSHHSHHSRQAPVIVNVTVPQAATGSPPAPALVPAALPAPAPVIVTPLTLVEPAVVAQPAPKKATSRASTILASPAPSIKGMKLPSALRPQKEPAAALVVPIPEEIVAETDQVYTMDNGDTVETKVVTTTTTTKRGSTPPAPAAVEPLSAAPAPDWTQYVRNIGPPAPPSKAPPPAVPASLPKPAPPRFIETTTVETLSYPANIPAGSVNTSATTVGNATSAGAGGARSAALTEQVQPIGTKAGIRPIPYIDYSNLVRQLRTPGIHLMTVEPPASDPPALPRRTAPTIAPTRRTTPAAKTSRSPPGAVPQTIASLSMDVERDSKGNEHIHARLRDRRGTKKMEVDNTPTSTKGLDLDVDDEVLESITVIEEKQRKKDKGKKNKKDKDKDRNHEPSSKEPLYKPIPGALPPPKSERYASPPALDEIENKSRERFEKKWMPGGQPPEYGGGMAQGWRGLSMPPMGPSLFPRAPPLMAPTPGMFGPPMMNPYMLGQMNMTPPVLPPGGMPGGMYPMGVPGMGPVMPYGGGMGMGMMGYPGAARSVMGGAPGGMGMPMQALGMGMGVGMGMGMPGIGGPTYGFGMMGQR